MISDAELFRQLDEYAADLEEFSIQGLSETDWLVGEIMRLQWLLAREFNRRFCTEHEDCRLDLEMSRLCLESL